ncbi:MAG: ABC transporter ATP-binding protein, partial [Candidatus Freyarchaeota archaeon]
MEHVIETVNLTKRYGEILAVDHISFTVRAGEVFGFLGPNGAGKTTTIRMLTGVIKPDAGDAYILGYNILKEPVKVKQLMGVVPEMANAYVDLSAWNNLMLIGELYGVPKRERERRAIQLLKEFGLYERRKQLVRGFSRGMKQKLLFCMALINEPQILFLDEPTSGLDVESARHVREMIREYNREGTTVFLSTHNMEEANQLCDRIAIINHGVIAAIDSPEGLKAKSSGLQSVEVAFSKPINPGELPETAEVIETRKVGDKVIVYTRDPYLTICNL